MRFLKEGASAANAGVSSVTRFLLWSTCCVTVSGFAVCPCPVSAADPVSTTSTPISIADALQARADSSVTTERQVSIAATTDPTDAFLAYLFAGGSCKVTYFCELIGFGGKRKDQAFWTQTVTSFDSSSCKYGYSCDSVVDIGDEFAGRSALCDKGGPMWNYADFYATDSTSVPCLEIPLSKQIRKFP